jgi:chemotaxis protein CheX
MTRRVKLDETLDLQATRRLAELLAMTKGPIMLDASQVTYVGGLAAQLILAAHLSGGPEGAGFTVADPSPGFDDGMRRLGIDPATFSA